MKIRIFTDSIGLDRRHFVHCSWPVGFAPLLWLDVCCPCSYVIMYMVFVLLVNYTSGCCAFRTVSWLAYVHIKTYNVIFIFLNYFHVSSIIYFFSSIVLLNYNIWKIYFINKLFIKKYFIFHISVCTTDNVFD